MPPLEVHGAEAPAAEAVAAAAMIAASAAAAEAAVMALPAAAAAVAAGTAVARDRSSTAALSVLKAAGTAQKIIARAGARPSMIRGSDAILVVPAAVCLLMHPGEAAPESPAVLPGGNVVAAAAIAAGQNGSQNESIAGQAVI